MAQLQGREGQLVANIAELKGRIAEIEHQRLQADKDRHASIIKELRELEAQQGEFFERKIATEDQLKRVDIRAPQDGVIHELMVHTIGGVVGPGETLMSVVPQHDNLIVEAKIAPQDIDQLQHNQKAIIRLSAFNQRTTPEFEGTIAHISGDLQKQQPTGEIFYTIRLALQPNQNLEKLKLIPGMPAEVFIQTGSRSPLSFFMKPLTDNLKRAFNEE
jgi:HlyD family secretion protein